MVEARVGMKPRRDCRKETSSGRVGAGAGATEGVIEAVGGDHAGAAAKGHGDLDGVGGEVVAAPGCASNAGETDGHEQQHAGAAVFAEASQEGGCAETGDEDSEAAVGVLFCREQMCGGDGKGEQDRGQEAVGDAKGRGPDAEPVGPVGWGGSDAGGDHACSA